jgi:hypothetical protein
MLVEIVPHSGMIVLSEIVGGSLMTRRYIGYTKQEAIQQFRQDIKDEKRDIQDNERVLSWSTS